MLILLIGMGVALTACGYVAAFETALDASPATFRWASGIALMAMAFGPRFARWLVRRFMGLARGRWPRSSPPLPVEISGGDRNVEWTVVALVGGVAGVGVLLMPWMLATAQYFYIWALREFLWTARTLGVLDILIMLAAAPPFVLLGMLAQCAHRLGADNRRWHPEVSATMLCGAGLGLCVAGFLQQRLGGHALVLRSAAVPLLIAAMVAVWRSGPRTRSRRARSPRALLTEPESGNHWPMVLRLALALATVTATTAVIVWVYVVDALDMAAEVWRPFTGGVLLVSAGMGLGIACRRRGSTTTHWVGAFGMRCALAGGALAAGMVVFNLVTRASYPAFLHSPAVWVLWVFGACLPMMVLAWALGGGLLAFLSRSADDPEAGSSLLQIILGAAGCACLAVACPLLEWVGSYPTLVAMALALLAMGGTLLIHDPYMGRVPQRLRLGGIFGGVVVMTFLMPEAGRHWLGHQQRLRGQMVESWWVTHDVTGVDRARDGAGYAVTGPGDLVDWYRVRAGSRVGVVSMFGDLRLELPTGFTGRIDQWPVLAGRDAISRLDARAGGDEQPALQSLRATRERYDVLIVALDDAPAEFACRMMAEGLIERAWARLSRDAALVCVLPSDKGVALAVQQGLRAAMQHEGDTRVRFADLRVGGRVCLGILADRGAGGGDRDADWASDEQWSSDHWRATRGPESLATGP